MINAVAENSRSKFLNEVGSHSFDLEECLLHKYPISHLFLALGFHSERILGRLHAFIKDHPNRITKQLKLLEHFRMETGRNPIGLQTRVKELLGLLVLLKKGEIDRNIAKERLEVMHSVRLVGSNLDSDAPSHSQFTLNKLELVMEKILERTKYVVCALDHRIYLEIPKILSKWQGEVMLSIGKTKENFDLLVAFDYQRFWPPISIDTTSYVDNFDYDTKQTIVENICKHLTSESQRRQSEACRKISQSFDHVTGPTVHLIASNLSATLESSWNRQLQDNAAYLEACLEKGESEAILADIEQTLAERSEIFSARLLSLLQEHLG